MPVAFFYAHYAFSPFLNMAIDEFLLREALATPGSTFLRLYTWQPGGITFGFNQRRESALNWEQVGQTPVVRRVTGGRAIYHDPSELTYAIAVNSHQHPTPQLVGSLAQVSANLARALGGFTAAVGIPAEYERQSASENANPAFFHTAPCFASSAKYELIAQGRKVVASAQKRLGDALLQHGSIKLAGLCQHPGLDPQSAPIANQLASVSASEFAQFAHLFRISMGEGLGVQFLPQERHFEAEPSVRELVARIQSGPCERREIIKQSGDASSL